MGSQGGQRRTFENAKSMLKGEENLKLDTNKGRECQAQLPAWAKVQKKKEYGTQAKRYSTRRGRRKW